MWQSDFIDHNIGKWTEFHYGDDDIEVHRVLRRSDALIWSELLSDSGFVTGLVLQKMDRIEMMVSGTEYLHYYSKIEEYLSCSFDFDYQMVETKSFGEAFEFLKFTNLACDVERNDLTLWKILPIEIQDRVLVFKSFKDGRFEEGMSIIELENVTKLIVRPIHLGIRGLFGLNSEA